MFLSTERGSGRATGRWVRPLPRSGSQDPQAAPRHHPRPARSHPQGLDLSDVLTRLLAHPHVHDIHDLHATQVATGLPVLTAHLVVDDSCFHDGHLASMLDELQACLDEDFDVEHSTLQFEAASHAAHEHATHP